ncbi:tyrosine-type recombinase/integrase [Herbaspirillum autotrophicum]|uniref:tyrosine-type recombinase/integrase n=1 Tax=Herbaspirillum autotrophicum TaxID=180195 RepID=UPI00067E5F8E|nr:tyrosine-type recombinase/integrase [Herbaspirillum autotrophicum]
MAYIRKYRDKWRAEVQRHGHRATHVTDTKREAQAWALKKESELDALKGSGGKTFLDAVEKYKNTVSITKRSPEWEGRRLDAMLDHFGPETKITDIDSAVIGEWRDERLKTVTGSTVQREANLLRNLFTVAVDEWRWMDRHPFKGVRLPEHNESRYQLWGWQDIKKVLRAGEKSGGKIGQITHAFHIALRTAMRMSEVLAAPDNFNERRRVVILARTKTTGRDEVPIGRIAAKLLKGYVFTVEANEGSVLFSKLCRQLMIQGLTFHDSRATALTHLAKKVDVMVLARISRHKDINLLHRVYYRETADSIAAKL